MSIKDARGHDVPGELEAPDYRDTNRLSASINDVVPVANVTERSQLLADLAAQNPPYVPSTARPLYTHRADAPIGGELEYTVDGTTFRRPAPQAWVHDGAGGGALTTLWATAAAPASLLLPVGTYLVAVKASFILSLAANSKLEAHLFNAAGVAFGSGQGFDRNVGSSAQSGTTSFTAEFSRIITVTDPSSPVQVRTRATPVGGTASNGSQMLAAIRVSM